MKYLKFNNITLLLPYIIINSTVSKPDTTKTFSGSKNYLKNSTIWYGINLVCNPIDYNTLTINGMALNLGFFDKINYEENIEYININGLNVSLLMSLTKGNFNGMAISGLLVGLGNLKANSINGIAASGIFGVEAKELNGMGLSLMGVFEEKINVIGMGILGNGGHLVNGILIGGLFNSFSRVNGVSIGCINTIESFSQYATQYANGLLIGILNIVDANGFSIGLVNISNSWVQIGIFNKGNSPVQIGLLNFDENMRFNLPLIYIRF